MANCLWGQYGGGIFRYMPIQEEADANMGKSVDRPILTTRSASKNPTRGTDLIRART